MGNSLAVGVGVRKSSLGGTGGGDRVILHISGYRLFLGSPILNF